MESIVRSLQPHSPTRAVVLGGGGSSGNAWLIGVVAGLMETGLDLTQADLIVGTSAGSTTAVQITGADPAELQSDILAAAELRRAGPSRGGAATPATNHLDRTSAIIAAARDPADMRRRLGAMGLEAGPPRNRSEQWRATVAARLPSRRWPDQPLLIPAVDAETGDPVVFDRHSGVELVDAVAASCSSGVAYPIGSRWYIDGGYRTNADNADLAAGFARVLVLSPFGGRSRTPVAWGLHLRSQVEELRAGGSRVEAVFPERSVEQLFGANAMNPALRAPAARAGYDQAGAVAEQLQGLWG